MENIVRPHFPEIHNNPTMPLVIKNMSIMEYLNSGAVGVFFGGIAFFSPHARHMRGPAGLTGAFIGTFGYGTLFVVTFLP